jgi:hypothetical protein
MPWWLPRRGRAPGGPPRPSRRPSRRPATVVVLLACLLVGSACQATTRVTISVGPAGDGQVLVALRLDRDAARRFHNLADLVKVGDLRRAGWVITGPVDGADGSATISAARRFRDGAEAATVLAQLSGQTGPLHTLALRYHRTVLSTSTALSGSVDLRAGIDAFADRGLAAQLGFSSLSAALSALRQAGGADPQLRVEVAVQFPGGIDRAPGARRERGTAVWPIGFGRVVPIAASSTRRNWLNLGLLALCAASLVALAAVGLTRALGYGAAAERLQFGGRHGGGRPGRARRGRRGRRRSPAGRGGLGRTRRRGRLGRRRDSWRFGGAPRR